jgi:UPF0755 protein
MWTFLLAIVAVLAGAAGTYFVYKEYMKPGPLAEDRIFTVEPGGVAEVAAVLEDNGIIDNARIFEVMAYVSGARTRLRAGEYQFPKQASMQEVMALIASGKSITYKISVPEGFTSEMAVNRINENDVLTGPPAVVPPEGSIMPDTYVFRRGMTRQKLVEDMRAAQTKLIDELWGVRLSVPVIDSKEKAVTLASIVEKETGVAEERPLIASVFINRLKKGMRLQSDPTIIYGIAGGKGKLDRSLTRTDIETETPYNTYRIRGLPPGPIANPGRAALEAVLNPPSTEFLYFVADGTGGHAFASTLDEHNRNVRKWRQIAGSAAATAAAETPEIPAADADADADADAPPPPDTSEETAPQAGTQPATDEPPAPTPPSDALQQERAPPAGSTGAANQAQAPAASEPPAATPSAPVSAAPTTPPPAPPAAADAPSSTPGTGAATVPKPEAKPARPAAATTVAEADGETADGAAAKPAPKPGSIVTVAGRKVAIPRLKPRR